jgi:hypothetical protein
MCVCIRITLTLKGKEDLKTVIEQKIITSQTRPPARSSPLHSKSLLCSSAAAVGSPPVQSASSAVSTGGRSSRFRALDSDRGDRVTQIKEAHRGLRRCRQIARSLSPSAAAPLASLEGSQLAAVPSNRRRCHKTGQSRALRVQSQADRAVAWTRRFRHWTCRTFSWPAGLNAILVAGIAACWDPAHGSPFERAAEVWSTCNWPPSLSLLLVAAHSRRHFFRLLQ